MQEKQDVEALLQQGHTVQLKPQGSSMYPLFVPGRDEAVIAPMGASGPKRGDVVLYRRAGGVLVLHRVWRCKGEEFYAVGDHQKELEGPLDVSCVRGVLAGVVRGGRYFSVKNPIYRILSGLWLWLRPVRLELLQAASRLKHWLKAG